MPASKDEIVSFLSSQFPQSRYCVDEVSGGSATLSLLPEERDLRPGGTVSGPTLMGLADVALYVAVLSEIGIVPLAVTTNLSINFLRKPAAGARLRAECRLLKRGRSLAVGEVSLYSEGVDEPVAHVVGTYSIPPV